MGKVTGFIEFEQKKSTYAEVKERLRHWDEFVIPQSAQELSKQGARCMDCGVPFCHSGCPLGNIIPDFNDLVYQNRWQEALNRLLSTNNFPEFTGRICPAPCESACVLAINKPAVAIKDIEVAIINHAFEKNWLKPYRPLHSTGKKVAIVGSGPAGLAAADQLNKAGHQVTVYERADRIGGLLVYGIPDFKLAKKVVARRVDLMANSGITFHTQVEVGKTLNAEELLAQYDAVVMACGCTIPRDLPIEGRSCADVHFAMNFLVQANKRLANKNYRAEQEIVATGKHVVVIGGGDTGSDCVGTSLRQGAKSVTQIELLEKPPKVRNDDTPWPTHARLFKLTTSQEEGAVLDYAVLTQSFVFNKENKLCGLRCQRVRWLKDTQGRPKMEVIAGSDFEIKADIAFLALGFLHPQKEGLIHNLGIALNERGNVNTQFYQTNRPQVFSAGDMRRGQSLVVWAISEGRECANAVHQYLMGESLVSKAHSAVENLEVLVAKNQS